MKEIYILAILILISISILADNEIVMESEADENVQVIEMTVDRHGWTPNSFELQKDVPVQWKINAEELTYCNESIVIPTMEMTIELKKGEQIIEFIPVETGEISWSCWMNMIPGKFVVTEDGKSPEVQE